MKTTGVAFIIIILIWCLTQAKAQQYVASVKHYGPENGLSHREVNAIFQDQQGFMWFGTKFGLNRFDGLKFTSYTKEGNGLGFDDIQSIAQDAEGYLWLMGPYGQSHIMLFNPLTNKAVSFEEKFKKERPLHYFDIPQRLLSSTDGTIFFTNYQPAVLITYHPKSGLHYVSLPQFERLAVFGVTARNTVWGIADDTYLIELTADGRIINQFFHPQASIVICFGQRNAGIEFFYSVSHPANAQLKLFYSVNESGQRREWPYLLLQSMPQYIFPVCYAVDRKGLIWDGTSLRDSLNQVLVTISGQTAGEPIENRSFFRDHNGHFWLGTSFGIYQVELTENHFQRLFYQEATKTTTVTAIRGITVLGDKVFANLEKSGLYTFSSSGHSPQRLYTSSNPADFVNANGLTQDGQGKLYAGIGNHLVHYDPFTGKNTIMELPESSGVWALHPFGPEQWLVGGRRGLLLFQTKHGKIKPFTQYNAFTELSKAHILHIAPDLQGTLWICANTGLYTADTATGIIARYWSGGKKEFYLPAESYQHFYQDREGTYWLATANAGLIQWDRRQNQYRRFRRSEGLSNNNIYAVYPDAQGYLWLSSDYGIMKFDPVRFTTHAYFVEDGITHNEFNRIAHFQDEKGRIYFGGLNGITAFNPPDFQTQKPVAGPLLRITSFRQSDNAGMKIIDKTGEVVNSHIITILPNDRSSVLEFSLLNYVNADKTVYAYQFKGIDKDWTQQPEPSLRLSNLPYGEHQLLIKAQAADGQWSANTLSLHLIVVRPLYLRTWFLILMALLVIVCIWGWLRWRIWSHKIEKIRLQNEIRQATAHIEQQAQSLHRLNETKSRFFANISHEFRTPLTVILGLAAELKGHKSQPQKLAYMAGLIERNGTNLLRLINQILDLSKIEAGEMHLHPVRADLVGFIRYIGESFHSMAKAKDIQLHFISEEESFEADFDKNKLEDILYNLLSNALKFTPAGGHIYYQLKCTDKWEPLSLAGYYEALAPTAYLATPWIQISVRDSGPGLDYAKLANIFDRFYQADNQPETYSGGTGIGLSLVRELVALMQGGLAVRNQPDQGAEFIISLPLTRQAALGKELLINTIPFSVAQSQWLQPEQLISANKPLLLLVEDNHDVAAYIQLCLAEDYQVIWAGNGQEGIDMAFEKMPLVILSDVMMPLKDGLQLCDTLKNDQRTSHIPIVLLTAKAAVNDRIAGLRRGADAYLVKPFGREELLLVLGNLVQTRLVWQNHYSQLAINTLQANPAFIQPDESMESQFLMKLRTIIEAQLDNTALSIDTLCQLMGMSRTTLHLKMTALTGMSMNRYLRALRLQKAKELLSDSRLNISEIAYRVGFDDPKYFSRVFSEEFGLSPGSFRNSAGR